MRALHHLSRILALAALVACSSDNPEAASRALPVHDATTAIEDAVVFGGDAYGGGPGQDAGGPNQDAGGGMPDAVVFVDAGGGGPPDGAGPGQDAGGGVPDAGGGMPDAFFTADAAPPDAPPPDAPKPPKPRVVKCQGELKTTARIKGTSGQHHVDALDKHVTNYGFRTDAIEHCDRNWCKDNDPIGVYFTHHGGQGTVEWTTKCKPSGVADKPCVADITNHTPRNGAKFEDHNGKAQHFHLTSPHWPHWEHNHTCAFSGENPNIQVQKYCNTSLAVNSNARSNYIAYGILYSANHSSDIPAGVSIGVVAGPAFGAATYTPTHGNGTYGASRGYETAMGCKKVREQEMDTMIVEFWEPYVLETKNHSAEANNENGDFPDPVLE
jgi:hypothetical protein